MPRPVPTATEPAARREAPPVRLPQPVESGPTRRRMPESGPRAKTELPRRRPPAPVPVPVPQPPVTRPPAAEERPRRLPVEARSLESLEDEVTRYQRRAAKAAATKIPAPVQQQRRTARAVRRILTNRTSLRRAVIVATVIGPCKANEQT